MPLLVIAGPPRLPVLLLVLLHLPYGAYGARLLLGGLGILPLEACMMDVTTGEK